ncbi:hypothetical protein GH714_009962 [Hevea brasiliensis]|uniref:Retrotransposon gag domain-containing protein n=1 Tax=Hevea brasiliensis TaxID=3981 RepID=A0A6A6LGL8_HEVBR|nr:hypothetical protein GH714_009962 [Hevea brasiliensis]
MDKVEGSIADLEEAITTIRLNQDQIRLDQEQQFSRLENMIAALARGKSKYEMEVGWVARTEQYFEIHGIQNELKVSLALVSMEGAPLHWLRWLRQRNPQLTWEQLREELMQLYSDEMSDNPYEHLVALKQLGTVADYVDEFVARASRNNETGLQIERQRWHSSNDKAARNFFDGMKMKYPAHGLGPKARISQDQRPYFGPSSDKKRDGPLTKPPDKKPIALLAPPAKSSTTQLKQKGGVDFILGVAWLETLGEIHANWRQMTLKFQMGNRTVILQGDPSLSRTPVSLRALRKTVDVEFSSILWLVESDGGNNEVTNNLDSGQQEAMQTMLHQFADVFAEIKSLPPQRQADHQIRLLPATGQLRTDQRSLKHLLLQQASTPAKQYWLSELMGYSFMIEYKTGISNKAADACLVGMKK